MKIIGIAGYAGSGKSTLAKAISDEIYNRLPKDAVFSKEISICPIAMQMKLKFHELFSIDWEVNKTDFIPKLGMTLRQGYQAFGHGMRGVYPRIWIDLWNKYVSSAPVAVSNLVIVDDVRYINEVMEIVKKDKECVDCIVWLKGGEPCNNHEGEKELTQLPDIWYDIAIDSKSLSPQEMAKIVIEEFNLMKEF